MNATERSEMDEHYNSKNESNSRRYSKSSVGPEICPTVIKIHTPSASIRVHLRFVILILSLALLSSLPAWSQPSPDPQRVETSGKYQPEARATRLTPEEQRRLAVQPAGDGLWRIDQILIDAHQRSLSFPVAFQITDSNLEYALVTGRGKTHESLLVTDVLPVQLHIAALLLSVGNDSPLEIEVSWNTHGPEQKIKLGDLIRIARPDSPPIAWTYHARQLADGSLAAQSEQSLIALIDDPSALIHHLLPAHLNRDDIYLPATPNRPLPAKGLPLTLTLRFPEREDSEP